MNNVLFGESDSGAAEANHGSFSSVQLYIASIEVPSTPPQLLCAHNAERSLVTVDAPQPLVSHGKQRAVLTDHCAIDQARPSWVRSTDQLEMGQCEAVVRLNLELDSTVRWSAPFQGISFPKQRGFARPLEHQIILNLI